MSDPDKSKEIVKEQYRTTQNLQARIRLHQLYSSNTYGWYRWYLDHLENLPADCHILELGCGPAALWKGSQARVKSGWKVILSDYSAGMVNEAWKNLSGAAQFSYARIDAQDIPFPSACFDVVLANHMLYHVPNQEQAIAEIRRVLKPGGMLLAATNGARHLVEMDELVQRLEPGLAMNASCEVQHWRTAFTLENGSARLARCFSQVEVQRYIDGLVVTDAQPLVDYVLSMQTENAARVDEETVSRFREKVAAEIRKNGAVRILKDSGVLIAR